MDSETHTLLSCGVDPAKFILVGGDSDCIFVQNKETKVTRRIQRTPDKSVASTLECFPGLVPKLSAPKTTIMLFAKGWNADQ